MGGGNNWSSTSWGSWQTASYTGTVDNTGGGAFSGSGNSVTAGANSSTSSRSGNLRLSQTRSGIQENGNSWPSPSNINVPLYQDIKKIYISIYDNHYGSDLSIGYLYCNSSEPVPTTITVIGRYTFYNSYGEHFKQNFSATISKGYTDSNEFVTYNTNNNEYVEDQEITNVNPSTYNNITFIY